MYQLKLEENVRRFIGDMLVAHGGKTMSISALSDAVDISRVTLAKWIKDGWRLYHLTKHITDEELRVRAEQTYIRGDSFFFDHASEYARRVIDLRAKIEAGDFGEYWQEEERERKRSEPPPKPEWHWPTPPPPYAVEGTVTT